jgi:phosphatidylglycerophosphatase A
MGGHRIKIAYAAATIFYIGYLKPAPGTLASIVTLPFALFLWKFGGAPLYAATTVIIGVLGYWASNIVLKDIAESPLISENPAANESNSDGSKKKSLDPSYIVIDEVAGVLISAFLPFSLLQIVLPLPFLAISSFIIFRLFDIFKPLNIGWTDKNIRGAAGIILDDAVAGLYAGIAVTLLFLAAL